ncbi:MAG: hypothetical protein CM15mP122_5270 [Bacteroidota bacterium]|nr:MAG: hypothetical protein CM15mP122_5270 [Bacteroidota bacterium]
MVGLFTLTSNGFDFQWKILNDVAGMTFFKNFQNSCCNGGTFLEISGRFFLGGQSPKTFYHKKNRWKFPPF